VFNKKEELGDLKIHLKEIKENQDKLIKLKAKLQEQENN
jgi:hypothetical protein